MPEPGEATEHVDRRRPSPGPRPTGVVTFLFTDVEGSTSKWEADPEAMSASLRVHDDILRAEITERHGYIFTTAGDAFCAAFQRATDAVEAAAAVQERLADTVWPGPVLRVRMGLHLGEAEERENDYFGPVLNTGARVQSAGHGGQVLMTAAVHDTAGAEGTDLGHHELKDVAEPVLLWQLGKEEFPPLRTATNPSNLPTPATRLFGRIDEAREVRVLLRESRLVTLAAVGGTGKTRLAIAVAEQELKNWHDGVWFADLTQANDDDQVALVVARALGLEVLSADPAEEVAAYLAQRTVLLVLDNCEHVADGSAELAERILERGGASAVLATSREWLDIDGERVVQVRSLGSDDENSPAVRLFADRASAVEPSFRLDAETTPDVVELCARLDGIPLAIELAASRVTVLTPAKLLEGLDDRFRLLSGGRRRQRRRTLEATIDWSYDLLEPDDQRVFRHLGVFAGSFDLSAVAEVCELSNAAAVDTVESLYTRSLVARSDDWPDRFRLLETLKNYAEDRLVDTGEATAARSRHLEHFLAQGRVDHWVWGEDVRRAAELIPDTANLMLCLDQLERDDRWNDLADLLAGLPFVLRDDEVYRDLIERCGAALDDPDRAERLLRYAIWVDTWASDWASYVRHCKELSTSADPARASYGIILLSLVTGRTLPDKAQGYIDRFVEMAPVDASPGQRCVEALHRSMLAANQFRIDETHEWAVRGLEAAREGDGAVFVPVLEALRCVAAWSRGDLDEIDGGVDRIDSYFEPVGVRDTHSDYYRRFVATLAAVARDASPESIELTRSFAVDAATGRVKLAATDALVLLAALADHEGDRLRAAELVLSTTAGRSPAGIAAAMYLAQELGVREQLDQRYIDNQLDAEWVVRGADRPLRAELERRGWA